MARGKGIMLIVCGAGCPRGVMVKAMDYGILVSEFELHSRYYVHFRINSLGKDMIHLILLAMGQIVPLLLYIYIYIYIYIKQTV